MSALTGLQNPPLEEAHDPERGTPGPGGAEGACMFCSDELGLRSTGEDPIGFIEHLQANDACRREYQMWKQVITDEWHGD